MFIWDNLFVCEFSYKNTSKVYQQQTDRNARQVICCDMQMSQKNTFQSKERKNHYYANILAFYAHNYLIWHRRCNLLVINSIGYCSIKLITWLQLKHYLILLESNYIFLNLVWKWSIKRCDTCNFMVYFVQRLVTWDNVASTRNQAWNLYWKK